MQCNTLESNKLSAFSGRIMFCSRPLMGCSSSSSSKGFLGLWPICVCRDLSLRNSQNNAMNYPTHITGLLHFVYGLELALTTARSWCAWQKKSPPYFMIRVFGREYIFCWEAWWSGICDGGTKIHVMISVRLWLLLESPWHVCLYLASVFLFLLFLLPGMKAWAAWLIFIILHESWDMYNC